MADMVMIVDSALSEVPVNILPLIDSGDFVTIETGVAYNAGGLALYWHFTTVSGVTTTTQVTPTTGGDYDWSHQGQGMYTIEIPASGGASISNTEEGFGHFTGVATGVLPWRGPVIQFVPANVANSLVVGSDLLDVNTSQFGNAAGTFSSGRPEVNTSHIAGSAVSTSSAQIGANVVQVAGGATAASNLRRSAESIYYGTVSSGTTTTLVDSGLTEADTDHWNGRIVIFLTGSLAKQATDITGFDPSSDELTFSALTNAPSNGDTYVIV